MITANLEQRLKDIAVFLRIHTKGLFDDNVPEIPGVYFDNPDVAKALCMKVPQFLPPVSEQTDKSYMIRGTCNLVPLSFALWNGLVDPSKITKKFPEYFSRFLGSYKMFWLPREQQDLHEKRVEDLELSAVFVLDKEKKEGHRLTVLEKEGNSNKKALVALEGAHGTIADSLATIVIEERFDYFAIFRCCYETMAGRKFFTHFEPGLDYNCKIADILSMGYVMHFMGSFEPQVANFVIADLFREAVSIDFALHMQQHGYDIRVWKEKHGLIFVDGVRKS